MGGDRKRKEKEVVGNKTVALNSTRHSTSLERWEPRSCFERESSRDSIAYSPFFCCLFLHMCVCEGLFGFVGVFNYGNTGDNIPPRCRTRL